MKNGIILYLPPQTDMSAVHFYDSVSRLQSGIRGRRPFCDAGQDRRIIADTSDNKECHQKSKQEIKQRPCHNDRHPCPHRLTPEGTLSLVALILAEHHTRSAKRKQLP